MGVTTALPTGALGEWKGEGGPWPWPWPWAAAVVRVMVVEAEEQESAEELVGVGGGETRAKLPRRCLSETISWRWVLSSESFHRKRLRTCSASAVSRPSWF